MLASTVIADQDPNMLRVVVPLVGILAISASAAAQKVDVQHFHPTTTLQGLTTVKAAPGEAAGDYTAGALFSFGHDYLVVRDASGKRVGSLVGDRLDLMVTGNLGLTVDWDSLAIIQGLDVGITLPFVLIQTSDASSNNQGIGLNNKGQTGGMGDPRLQIRVTILTAEQIGVDVAVLPIISFPLSTGGSYLGDKSVAFTPEVAVSRKISAVLLAANFGYRVRPNFRAAQIDINDQLVWRAGLGVDLGELGLAENSVLALEAFGLAKAERPFRNAKQTPVEAMVTGRYRWQDTVITAGFGWGVNSGYGTPAYRLIAGLAFAPRVFDRDGDGIDDEADACPEQPEDGDRFEDEDGCPDPDNDKDGVTDRDDQCPLAPEDQDEFEDTDGCPDADNDADGIPDTRDKCPNDAEDVDQFEDADGCPDVDNDGDKILDTDDRCPTLPEDYNDNEDDDGCPDAADDNDGDGIANMSDQCPDDPEDLDGFEDDNGCPDPDNDQDGVPDSDDACSTEPEDKDGFLDEDGCPEDDNDGDGIWDQADRCPNEPEVINGIDDQDGCPDEGAQLVELRGARIEIREKVYFGSGRAVIEQRSHNLLAQVAAILGNHQEIRKLRIEGHTDSAGQEAYNLQLSRLRTESVKQYLMTQGIVDERLEAVGLGETKPIASNKSRRGREMNRRVEFVIVESEPPELASPNEGDLKAPTETPSENGSGTMLPAAPPPPPPAPAAPETDGTLPSDEAASADVVADPNTVLHQLPHPQSLRQLSATLWKTEVHADLLAERNGDAGGPDAELAEGTVVRIPRTMSYTVRKGDTLGGIAKTLLGKVQLYKAIAEASKDVLPDASKMDVGMVLTIPLVHPAVEKALNIKE